LKIINYKSNLEIYTPHIAARTKSSGAARESILFHSVLAALVFVFCALSLVYLSHSNAVATKGYQIKQLQEERAFLQSENDIWNLKVTRLQSLQELESSVHVSQMSVISEPSVFIAKSSEFAKR